MIVPNQIHSKHNELFEYVKILAEQHVKPAVFNFCEENGFAFIGRIKETSSLSEKIETGRYSAWSNLDDLFACSIVIPTLLEEEKTIDFLEKVFEKVEIRKRGSQKKSPEVFRFDTTRFIGKLKSPVKINSPIYDLFFEVQIRTAFEHAWSVTTHSLTYKSENVDWKLLRLSSQIKANVEQLDNLILGFSKSAEFLTESNWDEVNEKKKIKAFFANHFEKKHIPNELIPESWTRFSDNLYNLTRFRNETLTLENCLNAIDEEISAIDVSKFPMSISLLQFALGVLHRENVIPNKLEKKWKKYHSLVTTELETLYPSVKNIELKFDFEIK